MRRLHRYLSGSFSSIYDDRLVIAGLIICYYCDGPESYIMCLKSVQFDPDGSIIFFKKCSCDSNGRYGSNETISHYVDRDFIAVYKPPMNTSFSTKYDCVKGIITYNNKTYLVK